MAYFAAAAESPNSVGYNLRRVREMNARMEADLARSELEQHQRVQLRRTVGPLVRKCQRPFKL
jgi:hypothetical protein